MKRRRRLERIDLIVADHETPARPRSEVQCVSPDGYSPFYCGGWRVDRCPTADEQASRMEPDE